MQYSRKNMYIMAISFEMVIEGYKITGLTVEPKDKTVVHSVPSAGNCGPTCTEGRVRHSTLHILQPGVSDQHIEQKLLKMQ